jgi:hypothetical protein
MKIHDSAAGPILRSSCHTSPTLHRIMFKIRGDGPGVHFNIGLSVKEKAELDSISLQALMAMYKSAFSSGSSLYRGVNWHKDTQKWVARIRQKQNYLGSFLVEEDAARAYDRAEKEKNGR